MALPIRGLSTRSSRGRSSSSERSSRSDASSRLSGTSSQSSRSRRSRSKERHDVRGKKKDALLKNYSNFLSSKPSQRARDEDVECDRSRRSHGDRSRSSHRSRGMAASTGAHGSPFLIPPNQTLAPRSDIWFVLGVTSCAAMGSLVQTLGGGTRGAGATFAMVACSLSFTFSTIVALGMRYAPFRNKFTQERGPFRITVELMLLALLSMFWLPAIAVIANGSITSGLAVNGNEIWNANLFYSSWMSTLVCWYLFIEVATLSNRHGVIDRHVQVSGWRSNSLPKRWALLSLLGIVIFSSSLKIYSGPNCGGILKQTAYCSKCLFGIMVGGFVQLLLSCAVFVLYRLWQIRRISLEQRNKMTFAVGILSFIAQSVSVGLLTSPGGPASEAGSVYFSSWLGFVMVFELCLRYVEFFSVYGADGKRLPVNQGSRLIPVDRRLTATSLDESEYSRRRGRGSRSPSRQNEETLPMITDRSARSFNRSVGTASTTDSEEPILMLQIEGPSMQNRPPTHQGLPPPDSVATEPSLNQPSLSQRLAREPPSARHVTREPSDMFSIGSALKLEPGESSDESASKLEPKERNIGDTYSRGSSKGSGKTPEGYYLDNAAFGIRTSFHVDKLEELDQPKMSSHAGATIGTSSVPTAAPSRRSKSPRLASLAERSNERSTETSSINTQSPISSRYTESIEPTRPKSRPNSRQSSRHGSRGKTRPNGSKGSHRSSNSGSRPISRANNEEQSHGFSEVSSSVGTQDPPPTLSDADTTSDSFYDYMGKSKQDAAQQQHHHDGSNPRKQQSIRSKKSSRSDRSKSSRVSRGPPPPPFHRNDEAPPTPSVSSAAMPLQSVSAYGNSNFDVSEPTIDVAISGIQPTASEMAQLTMTMPMEYSYRDFDNQASNNSNVYDNGYAKKWSDSTGAEKTVQRSSDEDDNPSSVDNHSSEGLNQVDAVVAAALAYAEKSHGNGAEDNGISSTSTVSRNQIHNESIHSFYSRSQGYSMNQGPPQNHHLGGVEDMVARALSQAGEQKAAQQGRRRDTLLSSTRTDSSMYSEYSDSLGTSNSQNGGQFNC